LKNYKLIQKSTNFSKDLIVKSLNLKDIKDFDVEAIREGSEGVYCLCINQ